MSTIKEKYLLEGIKEFHSIVNIEEYVSGSFIMLSFLSIEIIVESVMYIHISLFY